MTPPRPDPLEVARAGRLHARHGFLTAVDLGVEVREVTEQMHEHARRNHWGDGLEVAMTKLRRLA